MHPGDRLHHPAIPQTETLAVDGLHASDVGRPELRDRNAGVAIDHARHGRRPQQLITEMPVHELVQIAEVLQQFPIGAERRRDELDQRLGIIRRNVIIGERRAECRGMRRGRDATFGGDAQGFLLDPTTAALQQRGIAGIDQRRQAALKDAIDA